MINQYLEKIKSFFGKNPLVPRIKDRLIFTAWIAGIILITSLIWVFTLNTRNNILLNSVNLVLEQNNGRLSGSLPGAGSHRMGISFPAGSNGSIIVFSFIAEGIIFPCIAVLDENGKVQEFIALNKQGQNILSRVSPTILALYSRRIEGQNYE